MGNSSSSRQHRIRMRPHMLHLRPDTQHRHHKHRQSSPLPVLQLLREQQQRQWQRQSASWTRQVQAAPQMQEHPLQVVPPMHWAQAFQQRLALCLGLTAAPPQEAAPPPQNLVAWAPPSCSV